MANGICVSNKETVETVSKFIKEIKSLLSQQMFNCFEILGILKDLT